MQPNELAVRDLLWAINSPSLLSAADDVLAPPKSPLSLDQIDPDHLLNFLRLDETRRVGRYFERLVLYWLRYLQPVSNLSHSIQLRDGGRTLGELDFVYSDDSGEIIHLETAAKFYLFDPHACQSRVAWVGPNAKDTLAKKLDRLFEHQLVIGQAHNSQITYAKAMMRGRLFYPYRNDRPNSSQRASNRLPSERSPIRATPPYESEPNSDELDRIASDALRGRYIRVSQLHLLDQSPERVYYVMPKPHWFASPVAEDHQGFNGASLTSVVGDQLIPFLLTYWKDRFRPTLLAHQLSQRSEISNRVMPEAEWLFIVSDEWPAN